MKRLIPKNSVKRFKIQKFQKGTTNRGIDMFPINGTSAQMVDWINKHPSETISFYNQYKNDPKMISLFGNNPEVRKAITTLYQRHNPMKSSSTQRTTTQPRTLQTITKSVSKAVNPDTYVTKEQQEVIKQQDTQSKAHLGNIVKMIINNLKNPGQTAIDTGLYFADIIGLPSNVTNYLRDLNVAVPQRGAAVVPAAIKSVVKGTPYTDEYRSELANPNIFTRMRTIYPLTNTDLNFSKSEKEAIRQMAGDKGYITNADIKRVDGRYGASGSTLSYVTNPIKVVETAMGQTGKGYDVFDFNTLGDVAEHDNQMYINMDKGLTDYAGMRASALKTNSLDYMPDKHKIVSIFTIK